MRDNKGFTLIEILIVVALLGALAIGLLATLDPFQQIRKGADTSKRNMASDLYRSIISYQAVKGEFPWSTTEQSGVTASDGSMTAVASGYINMVVDAGELKSDFVTLAGNNLDDLLITSTDNGGIMGLQVCYQPESKSFQNDPNTIYDNLGDAGTDCKANGGTANCYWCVK